MILSPTVSTCKHTICPWATGASSLFQCCVKCGTILVLELIFLTCTLLSGLSIGSDSCLEALFFLVGRMNEKEQLIN